jgi:NADPH-dependent 2,4-dienoyl-CoA reductase/sulfur reductase-like enzyme/nitrite reductase/ring-hydroxylating ferredoxin subunit
MSQKKEPTGPDLRTGIPLKEIPEGGSLIGHAGEDEVLLIRSGGAVFAVSPHCTHYHGPLSEGLVGGGSVRCPWHHACFDLRTGEALRAPAIDPISCWNVELNDGVVVVKDKRPLSKAARRRADNREPDKIVIVGGGAAGFAAAEMLRRKGFQKNVLMISGDPALPYDRPNLSKDYLAGAIPFKFVPLRDDEFYKTNNIETRVGVSALRLNAHSREIFLSDGGKVAYDSLLLATGAEPIHLDIPGADQPHVHVLRSLADCEAIISDAKVARRVVVIGASFIGLEVAAALRQRKLEVHVVAPDKVPMARILGQELGLFVRSLHEENGVVFHLEDKATSIGDRMVRLENGGSVEADLVVVGIGVRPRLELAEKAGIVLDHGIAVDQYLETTVSHVYAAGDIARWPDPHSGQSIRVEHWVVAERQGQTAAINMMGHKEQFNAVPFFWSQHYDVPINYVGHAESWDKIEVDGDPMKKDCLVRYLRNGRVAAVASIYRDLDSLKAEVAMESTKTS